MSPENLNRATYCPEDNKLRLYVGRVPRDEYEKLRSEGWQALHKQRDAGGGDFAATWTPERLKTALSYADLLEDEDMSPEERAADRAERFAGYRDRRAEEAGGHADRFEAGPAVHGFQDHARAVRAADRHDRVAGRAVDAWETAEYWTRRTAGVIAHRLYVSSPGVRMGRIKKLEAEQRKTEKAAKDWADTFKAWEVLRDMPDSEARAELVARAAGGLWCYSFQHPRPESMPAHSREGGCSLWSLMSLVQDPITPAEACALFFAKYKAPAEDGGPWARHYALRLAYERQMLEAEGGRAGQLDIIPGGFLQGRQIQKVNKSAASGRVVSVVVWGTRDGYTKESGYKEYARVPALVAVKVERMKPEAYRAPTAEELEQFNAERKAEKAARPAVAFINPTIEDARRLQLLMNAKAAAQDKGANCPRRGGQVEEMTQARYSAVWTDSKTTRTMHDVKCRVRLHGYHVESVVVLTDKPQKPFPASFWAAMEPAPAPAATVQAELFA